MFESDHATISIAEHPGHVELTITPNVSTESVHYEFRVFDTYDQAADFVKAWNLRVGVIRILEEYNVNMEGYSYYGANYGVPEEDYEEVARRIIEALL